MKMFLGLLGLSLILLAARPAAAEDIPPYLTGMTGQMLCSACVIASWVSFRCSRCSMKKQQLSLIESIVGGEP